MSNYQHYKVLNDGKMLLDTHMFCCSQTDSVAALPGWMSELYQNRGYSAVYARGMIWVQYIRLTPSLILCS